MESLARSRGCNAPFLGNAVTVCNSHSGSAPLCSPLSNDSLDISRLSHEMHILRGELRLAANQARLAAPIPVMIFHQFTIFIFFTFIDFLSI